MSSNDCLAGTTVRWPGPSHTNREVSGVFKAARVQFWSCTPVPNPNLGLASLDWFHPHPGPTLEVQFQYGNSRAELRPQHLACDGGWSLSEGRGWQKLLGGLASRAQNP